MLDGEYGDNLMDGLQSAMSVDELDPWRALEWNENMDAEIQDKCKLFFKWLKIPKELHSITRLEEKSVGMEIQVPLTITRLCRATANVKAPQVFTNRIEQFH